MSENVSLTALTSIQNDTTAVTKINSNNATITTAFSDVLSRSGVQPNSMNSALDMNSNRIINLPTAISVTEPVTLAQVNSALAANGNIATGTTSVPVSAAMQPVVAATSTSSALTLLGAPNPTATSSITWSGDQYFKTGRPWADVRAWGAKGDAVTNDSTAFQNAINSMSTNYGGGTVYVPPGTYVISSGITIPNSIRLVGAGKNVSILSAGGVDVANMIQIGTSAVQPNTGAFSSLEQLTIFGCGWNATDPIPTGNTVKVAAETQDGVRILECFVSYGYYTLNINAQDTVVDNCQISSSYGPAIVYLGSGGQIWSKRTSYDKGWPVSVYTGAAAIPWTANTGYSPGAVVTANNYWLQCKTGGTSSNGAAPTPKPYGANITDGSVVWLLVGLIGDAAIQIDTGTNECAFTMCDITGCYDTGIFLSNSQAGTGPGYVTVNQSIISQTRSIAINAQYGKSLIVSNSSIVNGGANGSNTFGVLIAGTFTGQVIINGNVLTGAGNNATGGNCVTINLVGNGYNIVNGNTITGANNGVSVIAGAKNFLISSNIIYSCQTPVIVATGTSDNYNIIYNLTKGCANAVNDGGSGANKSVTGNN